MATKPYSLSSIKIGDLAADGTMGTSLTEFYDPVRNTCNFSEADGTANPFYTEIADDAYEETYENGAKTLVADFYAESAEQMAEFFGGTVTAGTGGAGSSWKAPRNIEAKEQSIELTAKDGSKVQLVRVKCRFRPEFQFMRNNLPLIHLTGTILLPTDGVTEPWSWINAPTA